jgi:hypothetical protein
MDILPIDYDDDDRATLSWKTRNYQRAHNAAHTALRESWLKALGPVS